MIRRPPRSTRTDTLLPYTTLFRSTPSSGCAASSLRAIVDLPAPEGDDRTNRTPRRLKPCGSGWSGGEDGGVMPRKWRGRRSEEHTSELQSLMRISYAVFWLTKKNKAKVDKNEMNMRESVIASI